MMNNNELTLKEITVTLSYLEKKENISDEEKEHIEFLKKRRNKILETIL